MTNSNGIKNKGAASLNLSLDGQSQNESQEQNLFFSQNGVLLPESPDLNIVQDNTLASFSLPQIFSLKVLGAIFGTGQLEEKKEIIEYTVQPGDTLDSISKEFNISLNTLLWANNLTKNSKLKTGQKLIVLPVSGLIHFVKQGETLSEISKLYKADIDDIVSFNELAAEDDIYIGDILIIPNGQMPSRAPRLLPTNLADAYFIFPTQGKISQGLHWYNAVDVANKCGTPVYAAASGQVLRVKYGWNAGGGNYLTILHNNDITTYYGHILTSFVSPGEQVDIGQKIALTGGQPGAGGSGISTGCHLHFGVTGAKNPLTTLPFGYEIKYTK